MRKLLSFSFLVLGFLFACNDDVNCPICALPSPEQLILAEDYAKQAEKAKGEADTAYVSINYKDDSKKEGVAKAKAEVEKLFDGDKSVQEEVAKKSLTTLLSEAKEAKKEADANKKDRKKQDDFKKKARAAYERATRAKRAAETYQEAVNGADKAKFIKADMTGAENALKAAIDSVGKLKDEDFNGGSVTGPAEKTALEIALGKPETGGVKEKINNAKVAVNAAKDATQLNATADGEIKTALEEIQKQVKDEKEVSDSAVSKIKDATKKKAIIDELAKVERALKEAQKKAKDAK